LTSFKSQANESERNPSRTDPIWFKFSQLEVAASLLVAFNLAIAYPILDLLGRNAEFFVAHGASRAMVILIAVLLVLIVPAVLIATVLLIRRANPKAASIVHRASIALLLAALAVQVLNRTPLDMAVSPQVLIALALVLGYIASLAWFRYGHSTPKSVVRAGLAVPILVVFLFVMTDVQNILLPAAAREDVPVAVGNPVPVVMVVFDELPVASLVGSDLEIDRALFPNFSSIARDGTWYRNATSVASHTRWAIPALVTGYNAPRDSLPTATDHPDNLFSMLGDSYRVEALESMTALCPQSVCAVESEPDFLTTTQAIASDISVVAAHLLAPNAWTARLPAIDEGWANFTGTSATDSFSWERDARLGDLVGQFRTWLADLPASESDNELFFAHSLLVHKPWRYLPSGHEYPNVLFAGLGQEGWVTDSWLMAQAYQRHLLQVQAADTLLGELLNKLKADGVYERAMVIVTADHGISMQMGADPRAPREETLIDIAAIPLVVKYPGQTVGSTSDVPVETIDVVPTIAEVLDLDPRPSVEGTSLLSRLGGERNSRSLITGIGPLDMPVDIQNALTDLVSARIQLLRDASESLFELAAPQTADLIGKPITDLAIAAEPAPFSAEILNAEAYDQVDFSSLSLPALLGANLNSRLPPEEQAQIAVAVNGRIAATTRTFTRGGGQRSSELSAMIDPDFLTQGKNEISLYVITGNSAEGNILQPVSLLTSGS